MQDKAGDFNNAELPVPSEVRLAQGETLKLFLAIKYE